ncbi:MAG: four helix bundle protein [Candidatus Omnitrophica bacterium]|nr:four helix bundle protein [Candidatus Omnitrophota bacterium]
MYKLLTNFPSFEKYALSEQIKRAVYSIPSNIVEGHSKNSKKSFALFIYLLWVFRRIEIFFNFS